jgi:sugar diacid utilization regulator
MVEERVVNEHPDLTEAVLRYSRDIAFSAADVYARAAEARGLWDARLEALVVDSIISGETSQEISSRVAALGWRSDGQVAVLLGSAQASPDPDGLRKVSRKAGCDVLIGIQGRRQVVVIGLLTRANEAAAAIHDVALKLEEFFGSGPLILGTAVGTISEAPKSAKSALAAHAVAKANSKQPRPLLADELLPERALAGDSLARSTLLERYYYPLAASNPELLETLKTYLECGRSLEQTSKTLFVHANTVRYRLKRILEEISADATEPRMAFVLQVALLLGSINDNEYGMKR